MASVIVNYEYGSLLTSMLLCNHFNPADEVKLKSCVYKVMQRLTTPEIINACWYIIKQPNATQWLHEKVTIIMEKHDVPIEQFLRWTRTGEEACLVAVK